jgi:hypothetical protein
LGLLSSSSLSLGASPRPPPQRPYPPKSQKPRIHDGDVGSIEWVLATVIISGTHFSSTRMDDIPTPLLSHSLFLHMYPSHYFFTYNASVR